MTALNDRENISLVPIEIDSQNRLSLVPQTAGDDIYKLPEDLTFGIILDFEESFREANQKRVAELASSHETKESLDSLHLYIGQISCAPQLAKEKQIELAKMVEVGVFASDAHKNLDKGQKIEVTATPDELAELVEIGERAKSALYLANLALVVSIAYKFEGKGFPVLDAIQEGNIFLEEALERFDYTRDVAFSTWAYKYIWNHMKTTRAETARMIYLPIELFTKVGKLGNARREAGGHLTVDELAAKTGMEPDEIRRMQTIEMDATSLDVLIIDFVEHDANSSTSLEGTVTDSAFSQAAEALDSLTPALRKVVALRFGLDNASGQHSIDNIASLLGYASGDVVEGYLTVARRRMRVYFENRDKPKPALTRDLFEDLGISDFDSLLTRVFNRDKDGGYGDEAYRNMTAQRIIVERAVLLLGSERANIVSKYYGLDSDNPMTKEEVIEAVNAPSVRYVEKILKKTRVELKNLIPALAEGSIDFVEWHRQNVSRRNVLVYLASMGQAIPDNLRLVDLRVVARRHLKELKIKDTDEEIVTKLYGLGDDGMTYNTVELGQQYGVSNVAIGRLSNRVIARGSGVKI